LNRIPGLGSQNKQEGIRNVHKNTESREFFAILQYFSLEKCPETEQPTKKPALVATLIKSAPKPACNFIDQSAEPASRVSEHPDPGTIFLPFRRTPRMLNRTENTLGVWHHDSDPSVTGGYPGDASL
tara:strand:- start:102 stop:482 length:381 start_codon:yes stop_codon:yes gene_type:complete